MVCYLGAEAAYGHLHRVGTTLWQHLGAQIQSLESAPLLRSRRPHVHGRAAPLLPGPRAILKTRSAKSDRYKKVNISVLIVKIIPGQEFISNYVSPVLVPMWPSQDDRFSFFL